LLALQSVDLDKEREGLLEAIHSTSGQKRKKAAKRLRVVEAFCRSGNKPEWMILTVLPVLPPDLRPMVQLDGGRFATSDLNDLYRRVINRNNRLRRLIELGAPEVMIRNEKRMLQEAVDSLIDNGRRSRSVSPGGAHALMSLSDMLRGKQGRFRQNLLGKRVDYSGRAVIVVGPELKLHQCGLPRRMALELFKPFVMRRLVELGFAHNIKSARRQVERARPEVWDALSDIVHERPVLLNRAPTLHRLGIQAFELVLIDGNAIQVHPLVCSAFNADFDGDQMAVHVPLSRAAVKEARQQMLSIHNMLLPSSGEPVVSPTLDMVLGCFYLTTIRRGTKGEGMKFGSFDEAKLAYNLDVIDLGAEIQVRDVESAMLLKTSIGRVLLNEVLPAQLRFHNADLDKAALKRIVTECHKLVGDEGTAEVLDNLKQLGFRYATKSGTTIAMCDMEVPVGKPALLQKAEERIKLIDKQFQRGLITENERYDQVVQVWTEATTTIRDLISAKLDRYGGVYMMATSGAKGNISQITQMAGMRGLMTDPSGRIMEFPIRSSFREGLTVLEYFMSTHGARKGLADTALRTSDSGYLTRRLVDVAQDVIVTREDCETKDGIWVSDAPGKSLLPPLGDRILGRIAASDVVDPETGEFIVERNTEIDEGKVKAIEAAKIPKVHVRSPLTCMARKGVCQLCYGRDLARRKRVELGVAVGIVAAESIGEPGTQLTMRTFHTGGVVGLDITSGLPRVEELFEARSPKGQAVISEIDGCAEIVDAEGVRHIKITSLEMYHDEYNIPKGSLPAVATGQEVNVGMILTKPSVTRRGKKGSDVDAEKLPVEAVVARVSGKAEVQDGHIAVSYEEKDEREYVVPSTASVRVENGAQVRAGDQLTDGPMDQQDMLRIIGREAVQHYLVAEVQKVYRSQGVNINDKHIECIARQMLTKVRVDSSGDTSFPPGELVDRFKYEEGNAKVLAEGGEPATAQTVLLGITRASLNTDSWLAAASFQETTRVLTEASINGKVDRLAG
ncbi:MAG TPA: DNA-directed RNA polymerase subunit beta', partial [Dehalococcoidia bacterium]|nr:DNA-directed RNA polymerase subunit beta' [Dehalococcoidia bacterium]